MKTKYLIQQIGVITLLITPVHTHADSWSCSRSNDVREVHVERTSPAPVPCNVIYRKPTEGVEDQVLWNANHDESYCSEKAQGLITRLESAGWVCAETISETSEASDDQ